MSSEGHQEIGLDFKSALQIVLSDADRKMGDLYGGKLNVEHKGVRDLEVVDVTDDYEPGEIKGHHAIVIRVVDQMTPLDSELEAAIREKFETAGFEVKRIKER